MHVQPEFPFLVSVLVTCDLFRMSLAFSSCSVLRRDAGRTANYFVLSCAQCCILVQIRPRRAQRPEQRLCSFSTGHVSPLLYPLARTTTYHPRRWSRQPADLMTVRGDCQACDFSSLFHTPLFRSLLQRNSTYVLLPQSMDCNEGHNPWIATKTNLSMKLLSRRTHPIPRSPTPCVLRCQRRRGVCSRRCAGRASVVSAAASGGRHCRWCAGVLRRGRVRPVA